MELIFATHNEHKIAEIRAIANARFHIKSLTDIRFFEEIPETADTFRGNALQKAQLIYDRFQCNCFADDTGLEVEALDNRPGVFSARYAGPNATYADNVKKLCEELQEIENRKAHFLTVIALIWQGKKYFFEGKIEGKIIKEPRGLSGFGYDPVFIPDGYHSTFSEMTDFEKNKISHRGIAIRKMFDFLTFL